jgi:hypothetical protein
MDPALLARVLHVAECAALLARQALHPLLHADLDIPAFLLRMVALLSTGQGGAGLLASPSTASAALAWLSAAAAERTVAALLPFARDGLGGRVEGMRTDLVHLLATKNLDGVAVVDAGNAGVGVVTAQDMLFQEVEADEHVPYVAPFLDWMVSFLQWKSCCNYFVL